MDSFFHPISALKVNPFFIKKLQSLAGHRVIDLLLHIPHHFIKRTRVNNIAEISSQGQYIVRAKVLSHEEPFSKRTPYRVLCGDDSGVIVLNFFHYNNGYMRILCPIGAELTIAGHVEAFAGQYQINHPDHIIKQGKPQNGLDYEPVYPLTAGITNQMLSGIIRDLLKNVSKAPNWLPELIPFDEAIRKLHTIPDSYDALMRVSMDELLSVKLALKKLKEENQSKNGTQLDVSVDISDLLTNVPFKLTSDQTNAIEDIKQDLSSTSPMSRLLQGDVGSGKTIVALIASMYAIKNSMQVAILAPTEILARQHYDTVVRIMPKVISGLFIGSSKTARNKANAALQSGMVSIAVGTHALIQEDVTFKNLGLVIIDEQHKFGVEQRAALINKRPGTNALYMSATPIPRTLMLTLNGDMDISIIRQKPAGRIPITTSSISSTRIDEIIEKLKNNEKSKVYWVCPLIDESEKLDIKAATSRHKHLAEIFGDKALLVHGRTGKAEKENILAKFREPGFKILVSTTVIEVGVDVPDANIMIIEHAERFGLAQLHQLRGRVGRGSLQSYCILIYYSPLTTTAHQRISAIKSSEDGFEIAEKDLEIRGSGDLLGKMQTGLPEFKVANPMDLSLIKSLDTAKTQVSPESEAFFFRVFEKIISK